MSLSRLVSVWTDVEEGAESPTRSHGDEHLDDALYDGEVDDQPEEGDYEDEGEDELREAHRYRSDSASSQDIKMLHHSLRKHSRTGRVNFE